MASRGKRVASGVVGFLIIIYTVAISALDWASRGEFVYQKVKEGWVEILLGHFVNPPPWALLIAVVLGFAFLYYTLKEERQSLPDAPFPYAKPDEDTELTRAMYKAALRSNRTPEATLHLLTRLRTEGVELRNNVPEYLFSEELQAWIGKLHFWMKEVIGEIKKISAAEAEHFATLDAFPRPRVAIPNIRLGSSEDRQTFAREFAAHDYRLVKLDKFLSKHGIG
jgi:hypothetical protein